MTKIQIILIFFIPTILFSCRENKRDKAEVKKSNPQMINAVKKVGVADTLIFKDAGLATLVSHTEKLFSVFDTISPFGEYYIKKFKLNKYDIDTLYKYNSDDSIPHSPKILGFEATGILSGMICNDLEKILGWTNIDQYDLRLLLKNHLSTVRSPDGKLYSFGFEEKTGGSYKSIISYIHYKSDNNKSITINDQDNTIFNADGYYSIDTINTNDGVKYLLKGNVQGCDQCFGFYIDLVSFDKGRFIKDFSYNLGSRNFEGPDEMSSDFITYDSKQHIIKIRYITDDQTPTCNCGKHGSISEDSEEEDNRTGDITCIYKFNGKTFVLKNKKAKRLRS
ncbi:MAG: hypothetical protein ABI367_03175 [Mucilaginibacter sp.]